MSETQEKQPQELPTEQDTLQSKFIGITQNWKVKAGLVATAIISIVIGFFLLIFFWQHLVGGIGMKSWASRAGARPIECMIKDTNDDGYVSCSAMLEGEVVPLECGASIFNIGCRVNYGTAAAPPVRPSILPNGRGSL